MRPNKNVKVAYIKFLKANKGRSEEDIANALKSYVEIKNEQKEKRRKKLAPNTR